jgi:hypothetical protein
MRPDDIDEFVASIDAWDVIRRFDVDYDIPLRQQRATGLLRIAGAFDATIPSAGAQIIQLGAYWCEIVHADIDYRLDDGLRLTVESQSLAADLARAPSESPDGSYVLARWHDAVAKIRYRIAAFSRAVTSFGQALRVAEAAGLWWVEPDVRSDLLRAQFEALRQGLPVDAPRYQQSLTALVTGLDEALQTAETVAAEHAIELQQLDTAGSVEAREFLRGYSNLLHNYAVAVNEQSWLDRAARIELSRQVSQRALDISQVLGDGYREAQARNHQALLANQDGDLDSARFLFGQVAEGKWRRGALIARQQLANLEPDAGTRTDQLRQLLRGDLAVSSGSATGADLDVRAYTIKFFAASARKAGLSQPDGFTALEQEIENYELETARSVRQVIALPSYKRGYAGLVRPIYTAAASRALLRPWTDRKSLAENHGDALSFVEESSARELLDMLSAGNLITLPPPSVRPDPAAKPTPTAVSDQSLSSDPATNGRRGQAPRGQAPRDQARRGQARREENPQSAAELARVMQERASEFEAALQHQPVEVAAHDSEIAHKVRMFAANNPDTALIRYFLTGSGIEERISAFVIRGRYLRVVEGPLRADVTQLVRSVSTDAAPSLQQAVRMWELLLAEIWPDLIRDSLPKHLVVIPTDEVFALPLQVACPSIDDLRPLGIQLPTSFSVSATAFVTRSRHMLRRLAVDADDDLAALVGAQADDPYVTGDEITKSGWNVDRIALVGAALPGLPTGIRTLTPDWNGILQLAEIRPEFLVYIGHGGYLDDQAELGPYLQAPGGDVLTQFDVAGRLRLPRNKLTVLGACVAGQGMAAGGGEVAGFVRSLMAAGAGAIALPLWSVLDDAVVAAVGGLLQKSREQARQPGGGIFDVVESLHAINVKAAKRHRSAGALFEAMPLALYL